MDTQCKGKETVHDVPIGQEYLDMFPKHLPGVSPERQVEFRIILVPGVALITKAPYHLAPPEMQDLSTQL